MIKLLNIFESIKEKIQNLIEADSPTERTRRYNRKNKEKVRKYLKTTQEDRVARNRDRAKAVDRNGEAKMKNKDVHHPNGPHGGSWKSVKKDHGPDKK
jgi:Spy/CpxP family protein refolding chaperone